MKLKFTLVILLLLVSTTVAGIAAQVPSHSSQPNKRDIKFLYYGTEVSLQKLQEKTHNNYHCVEKPISDNSSSFFCFDSFIEVRSYMQNSAEQINGVVPNEICTPPRWWALYRQSFWSDLIGNLYEGYSLSNANEIWSIHRFNCARSITIYDYPNFDGSSITYSSSWPTLVFGGGSAIVF